jgi:DNA-binding MurR/RpiR family transcriptional regulator
MGNRDRREFGPDDSPEDLLRMLISSHTKAMREATSAIDLAVMMEVSRRIALSSHVDIYGVVGSAMLADELQGRLYASAFLPTPGRRSTAA